MKTTNQITKEIYECSQGEIVSAIIREAQLAAFKAGAEWATAHPSIPPEIEEEIKFMASSLKEIPK